MATQTRVSVEDYLQTPYEGLEPDYFDGEVIDRGMPMFDHSKAQHRIQIEADRFGSPLGWLVLPDLRLMVSPTRRLVPDISVYVTAPVERVPSTPGLAAIEILSPDDRYANLMRKLETLWQWGVPHVWTVDTDLRRLHKFDSNGYHEVPRLEIPEHRFVLTAEQIFR